MRFLQSDLRRNDRAGIRRWNAPVTSSVFHFRFTHHQILSAQLSGIGAIVASVCRYVDPDDPRPTAIHRHPVWQGAAA
jgi:hypothetical protein